MSANRRVGVEVFVTGGNAKSEFDAQAAGIRAVKAEAESAGPAATAAMNGVGASARGTAAAMGSISGAAKGASISMAEANRIYQNVVQAQGAGSKAALDMAAALGIESTATKAASVATAGKAAANETVTVSALEAARAEQAHALAEIESTAATDASSNAWLRKTNMINTGQGPLRGYDALVQAIARSMGGIPIAAAVGIPVVLALAQAFFKLNDEKEKAIKLDQEQIDLDVRRHAALNTGTLFTREYANVLRDKTAIDVMAKKAGEDLLIAQANENDAVRGSSSAYKESAAANDNLQQKIATYVIGLFHSVKGQTEATAARLEATKVTGEHVLAQIRLAAETGKTGAALIAERIAAGDTKVAIELLTDAVNRGAYAQERYRAGQGVIGDLRAKVAQEAAAAGVTLTHAEAQRRFTAALEARGAETVKLGQETVLTEKNLKAFNDEHHRGAGAARAQALAENALTRELRDAQAALVGDDFAARAKKIDNDIAAERESLRIKKHLNAQASADLVSLEAARIEKVNQDRAFAEQRFQDDLRQIKIRGISDDYDRERATIEFQLEKKAEALIKEFGISRNTTDKILAYRRAGEEELARWMIDRTIKLNADLDKIAMAMFKQEGADLEKQTMARFTTEAEQFKRHQSDMDALIKQFERRSGTGGGVIDISKVDTAVRSLHKLGMEARDVDKVFGTTSRSVAELTARIEALGDQSPEQIQKLADKIHVVQQGFMLAFNAIAAGFQAAISGSQSFGSALLASVLSALGQIAAAWGSFYVTLGVAELFTPGMHHAGVVHILQGGLLIAMGGVLAGVAGLINSSSSSSSGAGAGSSAASGAGSSAATGTTQRDPKPPISVVVPSFPRQRVPDVHFDSKDTAQIVLTALEGAGVFTARSIEKSHNRRALIKVTR